MNCPNLWDLNPPHCAITHVQNYLNDKTEKELENRISSHFFNKIVSIVLPNTIKIPNEIDNIFSDTDYYIVKNIKLSEFINRQFIEAFIRNGNLYALSLKSDENVNTTDNNYIALTPKKILHLVVNKLIYQSLGLEGKLYKFSKKNKSQYKIPVI